MPDTTRLLIVDDDDLVREVLHEWLTANGYDVTAAHSPAAALRALDDGLAVDALISDLCMPEMDGVSFIFEARRRRPSLPAMLLTAFGKMSINGTTRGDYVVAHKPINSAELIMKVAALTGR